jgi:hypothetical protein
MTVTGFRFPYRVRTTPDKGRGIFAAVAIPRGSVVWRHVAGLYSVYDESGFRAMIATLPDDRIVSELTYVFGLADLPGCLVRVRDDGILINHADDANLKTNRDVPLRAVLDPTASDYLQAATAALLEDRFALIATCDIAPGEELTNNYLTEADDPPFYAELCRTYGVDESYLDPAGG